MNVTNKSYLESTRMDRLMTSRRGTASQLVIAVSLVLLAAPVTAADQPQRTRRVLYNFDGDSCLSTKAGGKGPVPVNVDDVKRLIEEVAYEGSQVDTILVCVNAQVMYYPTKVGTMRGTLSTAEERAKWPASEKQRFENLKAFFDRDVDPYAVMLSEAKRLGREALLTFRMNDDHGNDFLRTQFQVDHPEWRLGTEQYRGKGALDFGRDEVRDHMFRLIEEAVKRYDCDGIELDFNRFPTFFKDGTTEERVTKMNSLVERIRQMLDDVGRERGRRLVLSVRPPSNGGISRYPAMRCVRPQMAAIRLRLPRRRGNAAAMFPPGSTTAGSISSLSRNSCSSVATCPSTNGSKPSRRFRSTAASNALVAAARKTSPRTNTELLQLNY